MHQAYLQALIAAKAATLSLGPPNGVFGDCFTFRL
jgi:hypothetical protein